jgi:exopolysaccharide production protein ExoY
MAFDFDPQVSVSALEPTLPRGANRKQDAKRFAKRAFDILFSATALILLAPVFAVVMLMLRSREPGPVFFSHNRVGLDGETFRCHKFRTMREDGDRRLAWVFEIDPIARSEWEAEQKLERDPRVHSLGDLLRRTSIDELPQFWNVLKGDMSIVGPRPITMAEAEKYGHHFADYCSVKPGITGAWQVGGRSDTSYAHRVVLDVDYIRNASFLDDIQIVFKTVGVVIGQRGAC